jgi:DNA-binding CsgD family transcriptional regulator
LKKYSSAEQDVMLSAQLYAIERESRFDLLTLKELGDLLPGVILVNDLNTFQNVYMSKAGCEYLQTSPDELYTLGPEYFSAKYFREDEMKWIAEGFMNMLAIGDQSQVCSFNQNVRPNVNADWKKFHLSGKILDQSQGHCIYMAQEVSKAGAAIHKIAKVIDFQAPNPVAFQKFSILTKREKEIFQLIAKGFSNIQISDALFISLATVLTHRKRIYGKLGLNKLSDVIRYADMFGLL